MTLTAESCSTIPRKVRAALDAPYALTNVTTFYTRHGDWFAYLCAIISVAGLLLNFRFRARTEAIIMNEELEHEYAGLKDQGP